MENLLKHDFTASNGLSACDADIRKNTSLSYFEVEDINGELQVSAEKGFGTGKYKNSKVENVEIINYDKFLTSLPHLFKKGKERCDMIVYTSNTSHIILNELKNRNHREEVLTKASSQLFSSLEEIMRVPSIAVFINKFTVKKCCYSNKQSVAPSPSINATVAFNRLNDIAVNGFKLSHPQIEALVFEFYEYRGTQVINLS